MSIEDIVGSPTRGIVPQFIPESNFAKGMGHVHMTELKYLVQVQSRDKKSLKMQKGQSEAVNRRRTDYNLQNITQKTINRATRTPLSTRGEPWCSVRVSSSCSACGTRRVTIVTNTVISHECI